MIAEKANFGRYGKTFQEGLVQLIFEDRPFADQITEVLDINFLELEYLQVFLRKIVTYRAKYNTHPSVQAMMAMVRTELESEDEVTQKQVREYFARIHTRELEENDILNIDVTAIVDGYYGDTSRMFSVGEISVKAKNLIDATYESLMNAIKILKPGVKLGDIGYEIQSLVEPRGFSVV